MLTLVPAVLTTRVLLRGRGDRDQRGASLSVLVLLWIGAILIIAGLVVDGGQRVAAAREAETAALGAARAAVDAGGSIRLAGEGKAGAGLIAARVYLAGLGEASGSAHLSHGVVRVETRASRPTVFLSLLGITEVHARASADADLVARGRDRS